MRIPSPTERRRARIEIIPLIDVVFFLLATFVMVSLSMVKNRGIPVNLPAAGASTPQQQNAVYATVTVMENGALFLNKQPVTAEALRGELVRLSKTEPDLRIFVHGDEHASFGKVIHVMDEILELGITKIVIQTRGQEGK